MRLERELCAGSVAWPALPERNWNHTSTSCRHHPLEGCSYKSQPWGPSHLHPPGCSPSLPLLKPKELNKSRRNTSLQSFSELQEVGKQKYTEDEYDPSGHFCSGSRGLLHGGPCAPATPCDAEPMDAGQEHAAPTAIGTPDQAALTWATLPSSWPRNSRLIYENLTSVQRNSQISPERTEITTPWIAYLHWKLRMNHSCRNAERSILFWKRSHCFHWEALYLVFKVLHTLTQLSQLSALSLPTQTLSDRLCPSIEPWRRWLPWLLQLVCPSPSSGPLYTPKNTSARSRKH